MQINDLTLLSGCDIPFEQGHLIIHVPRIKEIAFIGQVALYSGCELLCFSKNKLSKTDKINLKDYSDFDIILAMLRDKSEDTKTSKKYTMSLLALLFPNLQVRITDSRLIFEKDNQEQGFLDSTNIERFREILRAIFMLSSGKTNTNYNPVGDLAAKIAEKMRQGRNKVNQQKTNKNATIKSVFAKYISVLAVGQQKDINELMNYTICQLKDEYERFLLKQSYDLYVQQKMAGAKNVKAVPHWMKDLDDKEKDALTGSVRRNNHRKNKGKNNQ